jgi:hypothetical protein
MTWSIASRDAANDARCGLADGGYLRIWDAGRVTLLLEWTLGTPAFGASSAGVANVAPLTASNGLAAGTMAEWALQTSAGVDIKSGAGVALSPAPGELVLIGPSLVVAIGDPYTVAQLRVTQG